MNLWIIQDVCKHDQAVKLNNDSLNDFLLESANSSDSKEFRDEIKNLNIQKLLIVQHWSYMEKTRKGKVKEIALLSASERIGYYYWIETQCVENQNFKPNISRKIFEEILHQRSVSVIRDLWESISPVQILQTFKPAKPQDLLCVFPPFAAKSCWAKMKWKPQNLSLNFQIKPKSTLASLSLVSH